MPVKDLAEAQERLAPKVDLREYAGQWVALRDGVVVAHDLDPERLREHPEVRSDDVILPVPEPEGGYFL